MELGNDHDIAIVVKCKTRVMSARLSDASIISTAWESPAIICFVAENSTVSHESRVQIPKEVRRPRRYRAQVHDWMRGRAHRRKVRSQGW